MRGENRVRGETLEARNVGKEECDKKLWRSLFLPPYLAFCLVLKAPFTLVTLSYDVIQPLSNLLSLGL